MRYSVVSLLLNAFSGNRLWKPAWREPDPQPDYDVVIVGGGGGGLATAYYLATEFGVRRIAVLEKGLIGSGNIGRNTTIIRSNYMLAGNEPFYEFSMKLWEGLERELNYNAMVSQRGVLNLFHSDAQRDAFVRRGNTMRLYGADADLLDRAAVQRLYPFLDFDNARFPIKGGLLQRRGGTVRHDAVAWGYARGADRAGVDLIQNCAVTGFRIEGGRVRGVETDRGPIGAGKVAVAVVGSSSRVMQMAGIRLPIESHVLQAFASEALKPALEGVVTFGAGHFYISQSDKGGLVFGGDIDGYNSYAQRGNLPTVEDVCESGMALMPCLGRARLLRLWGGVMDMSMDGSPIIDRMPVDGLYFNGGWCYGGFKATPASGWCFAHLIARDEPHPTATTYRLDRFETGRMIDEKGQGAQPNRTRHGAGAMIIDHPLLGPRDAAEFVILGDASLIERPDTDAPDAVRRFYEYLYLRDNPTGRHRELWYHAHGDRSWLVVTRDTCTHEVLDVELAADVARRAAWPDRT